MSKYPEHDKMMAVSRESQAIGEFLDNGLREQGLMLAQRDADNGRLHIATKGIQEILADYFEIDLAVIEQEKRAMLEELRRL